MLLKFCIKIQSSKNVYHAVTYSIAPFTFIHNSNWMVYFYIFFFILPNWKVLIYYSLCVKCYKDKLIEREKNVKALRKACFVGIDHKDY